MLIGATINSKHPYDMWICDSGKTSNTVNSNENLYDSENINMEIRIGNGKNDCNKIWKIEILEISTVFLKR